MAQADFRTLVTSKIQDTGSPSKISSTRQDETIQEALKAYSRMRPVMKVQKITGTGSAYTFAHPTDWEDHFSWVLSVEYPTTTQDPEYVDANEYDGNRLQHDGSKQLQFFVLVLPAATDAYVAYAIRHTVDDAATPVDTVPLVDRDAVACLAAAKCCRQLAAYYGQVSDPSIGADVVNQRSKTGDYLKLADMLESDYREHMGIPKDGGLSGGASAIADLDQDLQENAGDRFFHTRRNR
jgi:hypothetical protein